MATPGVLINKSLRSSPQAAPYQKWRARLGRLFRQGNLLTTLRMAITQMLHLRH